LRLPAYPRVEVQEFKVMFSHDPHAKKRLKNADTFKQDLNLRVLLFRD
jgi:hypothetical protein